MTEVERLKIELEDALTVLESLDKGLAQSVRVKHKAQRLSERAIELNRFSGLELLIAEALIHAWSNETFHHQFRTLLSENEANILSPRIAKALRAAWDEIRPHIDDSEARREWGEFQAAFLIVLAGKRE